MNVLDWVFIAALAAGLVLGLIKGFLKPLFSIIGILVVAFGTSWLSPVVQGWMMGVEMSESIRSIIAVVIAAAVLFIICGVVSFILRKIITRGTTINLINRLIGGVLGVVIVYLLFAVIVAFVGGPMGDVAGLHEKFGDDVNNSWIATHIYSNNFFGKLVVDKMAEKMKEVIEKSTEASILHIADWFAQIKIA